MSDASWKIIRKYNGCCETRELVHKIVRMHLEEKLENRVTEGKKKNGC